MNQLQTKRRVVLVTGCGSGIGLAMAKRLFYSPQVHAIISAREQSIPHLEKKFPVSARFWLRKLDVQNEDEVIELVEEINHTCGGVDVLINNAGISYRSVVEHMDEESELHQLRTNYLGPMALIRAVIPTMREKGYGHIINVSSVSGMVAMPTMASYSASKHALEGATESLWYEMKPYGIHVSLVQPGFVNSNSFRNVFLSKKAKISGELDGPYAEYYSFIAPFVQRLMNHSLDTPDAIAGKIVGLIDRRRPPLWVPATFDAKLFAIMRKILPRSVFHHLMFRLLPGSKTWGKNFYKNKAHISNLGNLIPS